MRTFTYLSAPDTDTALAAISAEPNAKFLGGGTNLVDLMREHIEQPDTVIDITRLPLTGIDELPDGGLRVGALVRNSHLAAHPLIRTRYPLLSQAILHGASAQIAADALGVPFDAVHVEYGDSALPAAPAALNSNQTATIATSVLTACDKLKQKLDTLARRTGTVGQSCSATLTAAGLPSVEAAVGSDGRLGRLTNQARFMSKMMRDQRWSKAARGAQFCEVRVDPDTGEVRVSRWLGVFDVGRVINPKTAASQFRGAIVMGIGMALSEQTLVDPRNGRTMSAGLDSYYIPVHADIPSIDVTWLDEPDPTMPLGLIGLGEVGAAGVAAAIANAVFHATGKRIRDLPITLDKLL